MDRAHFLREILDSLTNEDVVDLLAHSVRTNQEAAVDVLSREAARRLLLEIEESA